MANIFALILAIATLVTGTIWCFERFKWGPARLRKVAAMNATASTLPNSMSNTVESDTLSKMAKQPSWIEHAVSIFPVLALVFVMRSFIYEPFQIPSGSMMPNLLIGDFILVKKYAYGIKDPITQTTLIPTGHPKRGDVAVFKYPLNPRLDYIKRVIGLPGDRISYDPITKQITVQPSCPTGKACNESLSINYSGWQPSDQVQRFRFQGDDAPSSGFFQIPLNKEISDEGIRLYTNNEHMGSAAYSILAVPGAHDQLGSYYQQGNYPLGQWVVPEGHYFMMGDNRDNSADSRYWGFVPERNLVGKATAIWMSFEKQEGEWPTGVRFNRIGSIN
ncbi:signal peptidase I [Candidatus Regiella insecticola 5.15]|uniref:Signal peptidase I n=1 Tax=Candidatus Regiella insecticola 5.15 TaxID=1005043 RepID=G2GZT1_9ENTR|nr:signal peptidase I [Candidatus Regiella insecticola]EGY28751.1 signal peptidase I [Candidatus Regiella insecticola 5.15]